MQNKKRLELYIFICMGNVVNVNEIFSMEYADDVMNSDDAGLPNPK